MEPSKLLDNGKPKKQDQLKPSEQMIKHTRKASGINQPYNTFGSVSIPSNKPIFNSMVLIEMQGKSKQTSKIEALQIELVDDVPSSNYRKSKGIQIPKEPQAPVQFMRKISHGTSLSARNKAQKGGSANKKFVFNNPAIIHPKDVNDFKDRRPSQDVELHNQVEKSFSSCQNYRNSQPRK